MPDLAQYAAAKGRGATAWGALLLAVSLACGTSGAPRGAERLTGVGPFPGGPAPPADGLALPSLDVAWSPATITAGDVGQLRTLLRSFDVAVLSTPGDGVRRPTHAAALRAAVASLTQRTRWLSPHRVASTDRTQPRNESDGALDRPHYGPDGVTLDPQWLTAAGEGADAVVVVDEASADDDAWRRLPVRAVGSCEPVLDALATGQEHGLAEIEPFVVHVDALLLQVYRPAVAAMTADWIEELSPYRAEHRGDIDRREHACGRAYLCHVRQIAACTGREGADCSIAPRTFLQGGLMIGAVVGEHAPQDPDCPRLVGRDYVLASQQLATEAAEAVGGVLDRRWLQLADRLGSLTEVHAALEETCPPRRRRFAPDDLDRARNRLAEIGDALAGALTGADGGVWRPGGEAMLIAGVGAVQPLADWYGGRASASELAVADARALAAWMHTRSRCRGEAGERPWVVRVADPRAAEAAPFVTYVYPEELLCDGLPPQ